MVAGVKCVPKLADTVFAGSLACDVDSGYSFHVIHVPPTADEVTSMCQSDKCKTLIKNMRDVAPAECVYDDFFLYKDLLNGFLAQCGNSPASTGEAPFTPSSASSPEAATTPTTGGATSNNTPSPASSSGGGGSGLPMPLAVAGVFVIVVAVLIKMWFQKKRLDREGPIIVFPSSTGSDRTHQHQQQQQMAYDNVDFATVAPSMYTNMEAGYGSPTKKNNNNKNQSSMSTAATSSSYDEDSTTGPKKAFYLDRSQIPMLKDSQILASRVPVDKVKIGALLKSGGFGQVYKGTFQKQIVAIKRLLPIHRSSTKHINDFLKEVKLMASFQHPRIVQFVGVAWKREDDIWVVIEFMSGGDLRGQLQKWKTDNKPMGFDKTKLKIALHVAEALQYLHSREPIILHRDLKSHNILLSNNYDAKLTDFGISRENADATMTRGVGTSLWMAPEVMMGGRYDDKADVFCFGIVMSELDTNDLPYASQVNVNHQTTNILEVLQDVSRGRLTVDFSYATDPDIVAIGRDCVAVDPRDRPTMEQVLDRLNQVWHEFR